MNQLCLIWNSSQCVVAMAFIITRDFLRKAQVVWLQCESRGGGLTAWDQSKLCILSLLRAMATVKLYSYYCTPRVAPVLRLIHLAPSLLHTPQVYLLLIQSISLR